MSRLGFLDYFDNLKDPRHASYKTYPVDEILFVTLCAVICGADGWNDVEDFAKSKKEFLKNYLPFEQGIPSDDTFRRFFRSVDTNRFQECFINWVQSLNISRDNKVIAIDGKTSRRSHDGDRKALHMISAFATEARIVLGQQRCHEKSNEITAIPVLLDLLDIKSSIISIDAMGCQKSIAQKITEKEGDYILGLKGNQSNLHDDVKLFFEDDSLIAKLDKYEETDGGHGRVEVRRCTVTDDIEWLKENHAWAGLRSIVKIEYIDYHNSQKTQDIRYYISSLPANAKKIAESARSHWAVENSLHWVLDMSFNDDLSRIRKQNAPQNMAIIKHFALNMIRKVQQKRQSVKALRKQAGWNNKLLAHIIEQKNL